MGCSCEPPREWRLFWLPAIVRCAAWLVPPLKDSLQLWEDTEGLRTRLAYTAFFSRHQHMYTLMMTTEHGEHSLIMRLSEHDLLLPGELWLKHVIHNLSLAGYGSTDFLWEQCENMTLLVWKTWLPVYKALTWWKNLLLLALPFTKCVLKQSESQWWRY